MSLRAMLQVCPTYFGVTSDIARLAEICHKHDTPLLVDEAHGGHFAFHHSFPAPALAQGADVTIQSTHKVATLLRSSPRLLQPPSIITTASITPLRIWVGFACLACCGLRCEGLAPNPEG